MACVFSRNISWCPDRTAISSHSVPDQKYLNIFCTTFDSSYKLYTIFISEYINIYIYMYINIYIYIYICIYIYILYTIYIQYRYTLESEILEMLFSVMGFFLMGDFNHSSMKTALS